MPKKQTGWHYHNETPRRGDDARKLVTLEQDTMRWVGIRAFNHRDERWYNGGEPELLAQVIAWQDIPAPATGFFQRGMLHDANDAAASVSPSEKNPQ